MSTLEKLKNTVVPSLFAGGAALGIYYFLYDSDLSTSVPFGPINLPISVTVVASAGLGNMAGEILSQFVLPMIPKNDNVQKYEEFLIPPLLAGLSTYGVMKVFVSENTQLMPALITGSGGSIAGKYVYGMV